MPSFKEIVHTSKAIFFDVDGTLVDSNDLHAAAWAKALNHHGKTFSAKEIREWIGMGGDKILQDLVGIDDKGREGLLISADRSRFFKETYAPRITAFTNAGALLTWLKQQGFLTAIATSAQSDELQLILATVGLDGLVPLITTSDDADHSKPDPDIIEAALRKAKVVSSEALMIGDTPYDVKASLAAGVRVIAVRSGGWSDDALQGADLIVDDVEALFKLFQNNL